MHRKNKEKGGESKQKDQARDRVARFISCMMEKMLLSWQNFPSLTWYDQGIHEAHKLLFHAVSCTHINHECLYLYRHIQT